ncbi:hypothetical protein QR680_018704 [Steinernema hermaphroditum]|uniref:Uncharacterized protein n=1 Tax=Steinernema hermaphroditum TaxID=289476 RepID=A0AA39HIS7_9BILA|nr:hypothetical protein QR680_018704 [Steinernema hermaphroditum]
MNMYVFHHDQYEYYYNCSMHTKEEWDSFGVRQTNIGTFSIVVGVISLSLYLPCLKAMLDPSLWKLSCYKLMFLNGIIDIWGIVTSCFLSGYLGLKGAVFCSYPDFLYIYGAVIIAVWGAQCMTVFLLAFNRCIDFWQMSFLANLFEGRRMYFWWMCPIVYSLVTLFFAASAPYNSISNMWVMDPYFGIPGIEADRTPYENVMMLNINNLLLLIGLTSCYTFLIGSVWYKSRTTGAATMSKFQRQVSIQAFLICSIIYSTGGIYVCFEFFPTLLPQIFMTICFLLWQWGFCGVIMIYMIMNKSLRTGVINFYLGLLCYDKTRNTRVSTTFMGALYGENSFKLIQDLLLPMVTLRFTEAEMMAFRLVNFWNPGSIGLTVPTVSLVKKASEKVIEKVSGK